MNAYPKIYKPGFLILFVFFGLNSAMYAQSNSETEEAQKYEELLKYRTNHIIEQEKDAESFSETMTGIGSKTPENVFLAELVVPEDPEGLKEAEVHDPISEDVPVGDFEFVEYDDLFAGGDDGGSSGFGIGVSGRCPPGSGGFNF